jgi:carbamoylphosphate synthase small subunit
MINAFRTTLKITVMNHGIMVRAQSLVNDDCSGRVMTSLMASVFKKTVKVIIISQLKLAGQTYRKSAQPKCQKYLFGDN